MPELPHAAPVAVGFPTPDSIVVSRTDFSLMLEYVAGLRGWIDAANACLAVGK